MGARPAVVADPALAEWVAAVRREFDEGEAACPIDLALAPAPAGAK